jgi:flagellar hook assembly protein FlgD
MDNTPQSVSLKSGVISISARNPSTRSIGISYTVPDNDLVLVQIYDTHGKAVQTLVNAYQNAGNHTCILNGSLLSSGLYYCTVYTKHRQYGVEKIVIVK